jgi:hypothetical protein
MIGEATYIACKHKQQLLPSTKQELPAWIYVHGKVQFKSMCCLEGIECTDTESFDVSIEPKQTEDQPKQFDREHFANFYRKVRVFPVFPVFSFFFVFFGLFRNSLFQLFCFYTKTESFDVSIEPEQTEDPPRQFKNEYIWVFFRKFRVVPVCFGLLQNSSVCFGCFNIGSKH